MKLYIKTLQTPSKKLLEIINKFSKVVGYRNQYKKSFAFLYTNSKQSEKEIKKTIPFKTA